MKTFLKRFARDEAGSSATEYALIIAIVGVAIGGAALILGTNVPDASASTRSCVVSTDTAQDRQDTASATECVNTAEAEVSGVQNP